MDIYQRTQSCSQPTLMLTLYFQQSVSGEKCSSIRNIRSPVNQLSNLIACSFFHPSAIGIKLFGFAIGQFSCDLKICDHYQFNIIGMSSLRFFNLVVYILVIGGLLDGLHVSIFIYGVGIQNILIQDQNIGFLLWTQKLIPKFYCIYFCQFHSFGIAFFYHCGRHREIGRTISYLSIKVTAIWAVFRIHYCRKVTRVLRGKDFKTFPRVHCLEFILKKPILHAHVLRNWIIIQLFIHRSPKIENIYNKLNKYQIYNLLIIWVFVRLQEQTINYFIQFMKEKISEKTQKILKITLSLLTVIVAIVNLLELGLVGKNLSYTNKLTPPSLLSALNNAGVYYYSQISILVIGFLFNLSLIANSYAASYLSKKRFIPNLIIFIVLLAGSIVVAVSFMNGSQSYQSLLNNQYQQMMSNPNMCQQSLCQSATCARVKAFKSAHGMAISYAVIVSVLGIAMIPISYIININRIQQIEDLEK